MLRSLLDVVFPVRSLSGERGAWITDAECASLRGKPVIIESDALQRRGIRNLDRVIAVGAYDDAELLRRAIWSLKYARLPGLAAPLGALMADTFLQAGASTHALCPVPLHWLRRYQRGFNQADLLARAVGLRTNLPVFDGLRRMRHTGQQARRARRLERFVALRDAFDCLEPAPAAVTLIDDVSTTGATLDACAAALRRSGAITVDALVLALA